MRVREYADTQWDEALVQSVRDNITEIKCPMIFTAVECLRIMDRIELGAHLAEFHPEESQDVDYHFKQEEMKYLEGRRYNDRHEAA
jgi:hypothetical protein